MDLVNIPLYSSHSIPTEMAKKNIDGDRDIDKPKLLPLRKSILTMPKLGGGEFRVGLMHHGQIILLPAYKKRWL